MKTRRRNALTLDYRFIVLFSDIPHIACESEVMIPVINDDKFPIPSQQACIDNFPGINSLDVTSRFCFNANAFGNGRNPKSPLTLFSKISYHRAGGWGWQCSFFSGKAPKVKRASLFKSFKREIFDKLSFFFLFGL